MFGQHSHAHGARRLRQVASRIGAGALLMGSLTVGTVAVTSQLAAADSAYPVTATGSAEVNPDGSITVTVQGTWQWDRNDPCSENRWGTGWAIDWHDANQAGNFLGSINDTDYSVGAAEGNDLNPADNAVHYGEQCDETNAGTWGPESHTYAEGTVDFAPCAVTYDLHNGDTESGIRDGDLIATGEGYNDDNSVEHSSGADICAPIELAPHLTLNKTVINDDTVTGTATIANFTLTATPKEGGDAVINGADPDESPDAGIGADVEKDVTYVLSESGPEGYDASEWSCVGGTLEGNEVTLAAGELANCTITNNDNGDQQQIPPPPATTTTTLVAELPTTGSSSGSTVLIAGLGVLLGFGMTMFARRRRPA
ncbi:unannotated protein [freshwater metagenome]|uniref:Unannotated protein n=1 Tax=freshwater metagenome TaxID=449393 RepID=A0A6J7EHB5_9ZZZZ